MKTRGGGEAGKEKKPAALHKTLLPLLLSLATMLLVAVVEVVVVGGST